MAVSNLPWNWSWLLWKNYISLLLCYGRTKQYIVALWGVNKLYQQGVSERMDFFYGKLNWERKQEGCWNWCRGVSCDLLRSCTNYGGSWSSLVLFLYNSQSKREALQKVCKNTSQRRTDPNNSDQLKMNDDILGLPTINWTAQNMGAQKSKMKILAKDHGPITGCFFRN